ncbi:hypothetical protein LEP1GSC008_0601 [Leptospira kirschneri serovar Bulgarica str. Nikolaevo]|uniref:Uncharacterized protein n=1 Tax=Leptospira kirschneri serovar Bulgarica str. Nikolaevo TaxID=1240687 RepID=M6F0T7_9LEPT|nr:hypothetical protein LEP1GSC008_1556 [Leptospira kirschneri serovar Bulgarica str. Nikolaevo]EMK24543.1 hypothetical protein LEP1GSC008_2629 [Leptospira kirschneri serovar Bulgarica str. Nikolaevo]EMK24856.1 hypothetical protein LEP1GSC008_0601 [Leptospira kirschneri serovar Bulgarica str. Nikolaevo]
MFIHSFSKYHFRIPTLQMTSRVLRAFESPLLDLNQVDYTHQ